MNKKYFYFQPQYVSKFKCDGSKCGGKCCKHGWNIFVDVKTFEQYSRLEEVAPHVKFDSEKNNYVIVLDEKKSCPFVTEDNLCGLKLKYGEKFLSSTCATYPRITNDFGYFLERTLTLSCPVAAELILFEREPMTFEFVEVPEEIHSPAGKIFVQRIEATDKLKRILIDLQVAMISILQERTLSIDQRLIVLGFFLDRFDEIFSAEIFDEAALRKLIAAYESKKFLAEQVPLMLRSVTFDEEKFQRLILDLLEKVFDEEDNPLDKRILNVAENVIKRTSEKKIFLAEYSPFLENFLVNKLFMNIFPWKIEGSIAQNFATFVIEYKIFELIIFSEAIKGSVSRKILIDLADKFTTKFDHTQEYKTRIFNYFKGADDIWNFMNGLLEGRD